MISDTRHKRKSPLEDNHLSTTTNHNSISSLTKRFRATSDDKKLNSNELQNSTKMTISNGEQKSSLINFDESKLTPTMLAEYRHLQQELQCQEALLVLMQKLKTNQKLISQNNNNNNDNNNHLKQRSSMPTTATKLSQQSSTLNDGKMPLTATKQSLNSSTRSNSIKPPHPNQYTVNRSNQHSQQQSSKNSLNLSQATRQSNTNNNINNSQPAAATRLSSTISATATKNSSMNSTNNTSSSKTNGSSNDQHLLNAKLALRKQLEQTLLQIPTPKPTTCDLTFIPGVNGWSEFLAYLGLEQAMNTFADIVIRRTNDDVSFTPPNVCAQCGTDWSVTWHEISTAVNENNSDEKILCDRCTKTSQKKLLKQDHSNRLRQAFMKALQQEKELDAKFQQSPSSAAAAATTTTTNANPPAAIKQSSSSSSLSHQATKHSHQSTKSSSVKTNSNHHHHQHHHHHHNNSSNSKNSSSNHHHHRHHSSKTSSSKSHHSNSSSIPNLTPSPAETLASTLAALQSTEHMELFQKHFLSNMLPFAVANQTAAAALAAKTTQQQQQAAALAALPAMAASLMRQPNPAQYLLDMIPQAAKQHQQQQQQHHHRHSK